MSDRAMHLSGSVGRGRVTWDNPVAWPIALREFEGQRIRVDIDRERIVRSDKANRRWWGVLVPLAQHVLSEGRDIPLSKDQAHYVLVAAFAGCDETELGIVPVRTRTMTKEQFSVLMEKTQAWLADKGIEVPMQMEAAS